MNVQQLTLILQLNYVLLVIIVMQVQLQPQINVLLVPIVLLDLRSLFFVLQGHMQTLLVQVVVLNVLLDISALLEQETIQQIHVLLAITVLLELN